MRRTLLVLALALAALAAEALPAQAAAPTPGVLVPCTVGSTRLCATVTVPLDRTGALAGTVALHVESLPVAAAKGVVFLIAGGPGQASTDFVRTRASSESIQALFPGYDVVGVDVRGTGLSDRIRCPALEASARDLESVLPRAAVARCAEQLGPRRRFYSTLDHVADLEAVRAALGYEKAVMFGTSYGARLAYTYAALHPEHIDRLLLDSVPDLKGGYLTTESSLEAIPRVLTALCVRAACSSRGLQPLADLRKVVSAPQHTVTTVSASGAVTTLATGGDDAIMLLLAADRMPGLYELLPRVLRHAAAGDFAPLARLRMTLIGIDPSRNEFGAPALLVATSCADGPFPWRAGASEALRVTLLAERLAAVSKRVLGGRVPSIVQRRAVAGFCTAWPDPVATPPVASLPVPHVPTLIIAGALDLRTSLEGARAIAASIPGSQLLVVPDFGHAPLLSGDSRCSEAAVPAFLAGRRIAACRTPPPAPLAHSAVAAAASASAASPVTRARAVTQLVAADIEDALGYVVLAGRATVNGVVGTARISGRGITFDGYRVFGDVRISGTVTFKAGQRSPSGPLTAEDYDGNRLALTLGSDERVVALANGRVVGADLF